MIARFFQKSKPISFISLLVLLFLYSFVHFSKQNNSSLNLQNFLGVFSVFTLFVFMVFLADFIIFKNYLTKNNYYAIFIFVLLLGIFPQTLSFSKISIANLFILLSLRRLYSLRSQKDIPLKLFDSSFYLGIAFLLYPESIFFIILIYSSYFLYNRFFYKELLIPLIGFSIPIFLSFTYYFLTDSIPQFRSLVEINLDFTIDKRTYLSFFIPLSVLFIFLFLSIINIGIRQNKDVKEKKIFQLMLFTLFLGVLILIINTPDIEQSILFIFFPIAVLFANFFKTIKRYWIKEIFFYILLILSVKGMFW